MAFDVFIAGAGIIGSSIAWRLAQSGLRVLLADAGQMGGEASFAGAGMLAPGGEIEEHSAWNELAIEGLRLYPAFVAELQEETGLRIDFQRLGAVELAFSTNEWETLQAKAARQSALGIASCPLSKAELRQHSPLARHDVAGALFYPEDALVDPRDVMAALRAACPVRRVEIREGLRVASIDARARLVRVETSAGTFEAPAAVLAAGAWSSQIPVQEQTLPASYPVRGHLIGYALEPHALGPILRRGHTYLLQRAGGLVVAGTSSEQAGFDRALDLAIVADIHKRAAAVVPSLAGCQPAEEWLGFRPAAEGDRPAMGRCGQTSLWLAYGHYRNGILMAPPTAHRLAGEIIASLEKAQSVPPGRP